jgi:DNA-binding CsgD family transcriptional regulator
VWLLEALMQRAPDGLDECLESGMLRSEADGVAFRHELARLAIEESLTPHRAVVLHRRALAALVESPLGAQDLARLAHHAEAASDADAVLRYAPVAAEHAAAVGAHREAQRQYGRVLRLAGLATERRAELLERFADEGYVTDAREEAIAALDEALAIHRNAGELLKAGNALRLRARLKTPMGRMAEARLDALEATRILEQLAPGIELARAYAALSHVAMLGDDAGETIAWGRKAIALADRLGDTEALVSALNSVGTIELTRGELGGKDKLTRSLEVARSAGLVTDAGRAYINLSATLSRLGRHLDMARYVDEGIEYCQERGLDAWRKCLIAAKAENQLARGLWDQAAETASGVIDAPTDPVIRPVHDALRVRALVRARRGDPGHRAALEHAQAIGESVGELQFLAVEAAAHAECAWLEGRLQAIGPATDTAFELALRQRTPNFIGELGLWRWRAGLLDAPPPDAGEPYSYQIAGEWERAARYWRENGCHYQAALALADSQDGKALRQALDELQALGARPAAAIVARRLRELGERGLPRGPRPKTRANPAGLTPRELDVLQLLAEGLRNAQIAERLVVSRKTVDHHVSAILRKLDVRSRGEASAAAGRLGLR